jgi:integrase
LPKKLGFAKVRLHDLRHSHATILLDAGVPIHRVVARIGDGTYARLTEKDAMTDTVNALGTLILKN